MNRRVACALACCIAFSTQASLIINGSFEEPVLTTKDLHLPTERPDLPGWEIGGTGGDIGILRGDLLPGVNFFPADGDQHLAFNSGNTAPGTWISQTFDTIIGVEYKIGFYTSQSGPGGTAGYVGLNVSVKDADGQFLANKESAPTTRAYGSEQVFWFTATTAQSRLTILDTSKVTDAVDVWIDGVTVSAVPEPATYLAGLCSLAILGASSWRNRK